MFAILRRWGMGALAFLALIFYALSKKARADAEKARAEFAQRNTTAAEKRTQRLIDAQNAARQAMANGEEDLKDEIEKARRGDRSHFESND